MFFGLIGKTRWLPRSLIRWDYSIFPPKPLNEIQRKLTGTKISTSSTKFAFFWPISKQKWPPWLILQKGSTLYSGARDVALWASCLPSLSHKISNQNSVMLRLLNLRLIISLYILYVVYFEHAYAVQMNKCYLKLNRTVLLILLIINS